MLVLEGSTIERTPKMTQGPPSQRDRRGLQDLAKLANAPSLGPASKTPAPPAVTITNAEHDSGIVDLKIIAKQDEGAEARSKTTALASSPLFDDEAPGAPAPAAAPSSSAKAIVGAAASAPGSSAATVASGASGSKASASAAASAGKAGPMTWVFGGIGIAVVASGIFFFTRSPKTDVASDSSTKTPVATAPSAPSGAAATPSAAPAPSAPPAASVAAAGTDPSALPAATDELPANAAASGGGGAATNVTAGRKGTSAQAAKGSPAAGTGGSGVSGLSAMMAQATNQPATAPVSAGSVPAGALGDAVKRAVGANGASVAAPEQEAPAGPAFAAGTVPDKPSQGAVTSALNRALPKARACLNPDDPASRANITFGSSGVVSSVVVTGAAAGKSAEDCIKHALTKTLIPPFAQASYSANVNVRPN
jgi:hypothetical protein